jgi:hypothetical protein
MARRGAGWRWALVVGLVAALAALPSLVGALPASDAAVDAPQLRAEALASAGLAYSGVAESAGGLELPVTDQLTSVADLFSDRTTMRVWWRGATDSRVDVVGPTGETGYHRDAAGTWVWEYEADRATRARDAALALPTPPDLLPSTLGRRLLSEAADAELSRTGARRVAGRDALGLRVVPAAPAASVAAVDVWVDRDSGLPLQVQVLGRDRAVPALDTRFLDLDLATPAASTTAWVPPRGATIRSDPGADLLDEATRRIGRVTLPDSLAGLPRRTVEGAPPGVTVYGTGVTLLAVAPVPGRVAGGLQRVLSSSPDVVADDAGTRIAAGPLGLMLVDPPGPGAWLLTGTVTLDALATAARSLPPLGAGR